MFLSPCDTQGGREFLETGSLGVPRGNYSSELPTPRHTLSRAPNWGRKRLPTTSMHSIHGNQTTL